ncbi:hypothetical protein L228DRAFT_266570 [Xylona heveae TC161]|uniref:Alpha/beta-hydrolase n=1 Tax=Xylona heveae (strain CBS 132557 / TC161) TaxID=1328760 RepID=A0A165I1A2_XYLHT|nr:hypothetical protein L228DRAFT_266570 [Xylona heveae TC161]KZF24214.1 hypothetical protein L228DRAFT_266570 [Xylona heveae TC161]
MYAILLLLSILWLNDSAVAKVCTNITVPVSISARNAVFNLSPLQSNLDAATFTRNYTSIKANFTETTLTGYDTIHGDFNISAKFCRPGVTGSTFNSKNGTVQLLTHGIGFDKTYWDLSYNNYNYSYTDVAVDQYGFSTLSHDRLGVGNSSHPEDALNIVQASAEVEILLELTKMLREGTLPGINSAFSKVVHIGHSFGSVQSYTLASKYPDMTNGLILQGFSNNGSWFPATFAAWNSKLARFNEPLRFGNISAPEVQKLASKRKTVQFVNHTEKTLDVSPYEIEEIIEGTSTANLLAGIDSRPAMVPQDLPTGYMTWADASANQYSFLYPGYFDPGLLPFAEAHKFPYTTGEILTILGGPATAPEFTGPVQIMTGGKSLFFFLPLLLCLQTATYNLRSEPLKHAFLVPFFFPGAEQDNIFCGGDCFATGQPDVSSIPATADSAFPKASAFEAYIQPNTGHAVNVHYNSTAAFRVMQDFLVKHGLGGA